MKKLISTTVSIIMIAVIFVGCTGKPADGGNKNVATTTVTIEMDVNGEVTKKEYPTELKTVEELMVEKSSELGVTLTDSEYGKFVAGINSYVADSAKNEFIEFLVNGKAAEVGIAETPIVDKDVYTFRVSTF